MIASGRYRLTLRRARGDGQSPVGRLTVEQHRRRRHEIGHPLVVQRFRGVGRLVVVRITEIRGVGDLDGRYPPVPERSVVAPRTAGPGPAPAGRPPRRARCPGGRRRGRRARTRRPGRGACRWLRGSASRSTCWRSRAGSIRARISRARSLTTSVSGSAALRCVPSAVRRGAMALFPPWHQTGSTPVHPRPMVNRTDARHPRAPQTERDTAMLEHPNIDFDGDGHFDNYDTVADNHGHYAFVHHDTHGHVDAIAYDNNHDGLIDEMLVDHNHDGTMDTHLTDTNHDGYMDHSSPYGTGGGQPVEHPYIDFDGDGHGDSYTSFNDGYGTENFLHTDGHGHVDAIAQDGNHDGLIDREYVDQDHDGRIDHLLTDNNHDGYMDHSTSV